MSDDLVKRLGPILDRMDMTIEERAAHDAARIAELEADLKCVLDREAATYGRHGARRTVLEAERDALAARVKELEEREKFTLSDGQRLLRKIDVQGVCDDPDGCFEHPQVVVRCGPCAMKAAARVGVLVNDYTHSNAQAMRLQRECDRLAARVKELEGVLAKADDELKSAGYRDTQWPRPQIAALARKEGA